MALLNTVVAQAALARQLVPAARWPGPGNFDGQGTSMRRDMADSFHVGVGTVPPVPNLGPDQGWVGMSVQFLVDAAAAGGEHGGVGRAGFAPGPAGHQWDPPPG